MVKKVIRFVLMVLGGVALGVLVAFLFGWVVMLLWNWLMPLSVSGRRGGWSFSLISFSKRGIIGRIIISIGILIHPGRRSSKKR